MKNLAYNYNFFLYFLELLGLIPNVFVYLFILFMIYFIVITFVYFVMVTLPNVCFLKPMPRLRSFGNIYYQVFGAFLCVCFCVSSYLKWTDMQIFEFRRPVEYTEYCYVLSQITVNKFGWGLDSFAKIDLDSNGSISPEEVETAG